MSLLTEIKSLAPLHSPSLTVSWYTKAQNLLKSGSPAGSKRHQQLQQLLICWGFNKRMKKKQIFCVSKMNIQISSMRSNSKEVCNNLLLFGLVSINKNIFIHSLKSRLGLRAGSTRLNLPYNWSLE